MNNKKEFDSIYNIEVQRILLSFLIEDADVFVRCRNILKDVYFDEQLRRAVRFILSHTDEHKAIPNPLLIQAKTGVEIKRLADFGEIMNEDWFLDEITKFCRYKEFEIIINESYDLLQKGQEANIEARVREAMMISLVSDLGLDYFYDPKTRLQGMLDRPNLISTGYKSIDDKLYGGFEIGGLNIFYGLPNSGKSLILQNLALNWAMLGHVVIYFTMEMSKESISVRIDAMITGKTTKEVFHDIDDTSLIIKTRGKKAGRLQISKQKDSGTTVNDLRAYLKEFQIKTGLKPDAIVIDYLDIMHPTDKRIPISDLFNKDKAVSEEIRGMMGETKTFGATASQIGRCISLDSIVIEKTKGNIRIDSLNVGDKILGSDGYVSVKTMFPVKKQKTYLIKTKLGKTIKCSSNHNFPTNSGILSIATGLKKGIFINSYE